MSCRRPRACRIVELGLLIAVFSIHPHGVSADPRAIGTASRRADGIHTASGASDGRCVHVVRRGESIDGIAARYGTTRNALAAANRLARPDALRAGQRLKVPGCARGRAVPATTSSGEARRRSPAARSDPAPSVQEPKSRTDQAHFIWPVRGPVSSGYGRRGFWGWHSGVDIKAREGAPIRAAAPGTVMFSGWQSSYGRMIHIAHPNGFSTVYAHNLRNAVKVGDRVEAGTVIGAVGRTGRATANHLHFEVRRQGRAQSPLSLLEPRKAGPMLAKQSDGD